MSKDPTGSSKDLSASFLFSNAHKNKQFGETGITADVSHSLETASLERGGGERGKNYEKMTFKHRAIQDQLILKNEQIRYRDELERSGVKMPVPDAAKIYSNSIQHSKHFIKALGPIDLKGQTYFNKDGTRIVAKTPQSLTKDKDISMYRPQDYGIHSKAIYLKRKASKD